MPVLAASYEDLVALIGKKIPKDDLVARVPMMGGAYDGQDEAGRLLFEFFPNRPDLLSVEGLARACRAFFDVRPGLASFDVAPAAEDVHVDPSVAKVRPFLGFARVDGVKLDQARLDDLIELQERLTTGPGRRRRKVAIGIHDAARVRAPFHYKAVEPRSVRFVPLGHKKPMTPAEILVDHEKGRLYAHLVAEQPLVPLIVDAAEQVLSFPPVINGELTALTTQTQSVLVDVTGTDDRAVQTLLHIVVTALAERGGSIRAMRLKGSKASRTTPDLSPTEMRLEYERARQLLGIPVTPEAARINLGRMGHDVIPDGPQSVRVRTPAYRMDVLHPDDLVEDLGIGFGFERLAGRLPERALFGGLSSDTKKTRRARALLLGLGFTEVVSLSVTGRRDQFELLGAKQSPVVAIANPITQEQSIVRSRLVPSLLGLLRANKHRELPQSVFETGYVIPGPDQGARVELRVAGVRISTDANFSEIKGIVEAVTRDLGLASTLEAATPPGFLEGRAARVLGPDGTERGHFGELKPDAITRFELGAPVVGFELRL